MNYESVYPAYFFLAMFVIFAVEIIVIYVAIADDLKNIAKKSASFVSSLQILSSRSNQTTLLEYKPQVKAQNTLRKTVQPAQAVPPVMIPAPIAEPVSKHLQFKDIHTLDLIFDIPEGNIKDIDFTEDEDFVQTPLVVQKAVTKKTFVDFLSDEQKSKMSHFFFNYEGNAAFLELVEKKLKWKRGAKRKVLVLTDINEEKKVTFSHYLTFEKSDLLDVIDPEIFWGVDVCVAVTTEESLPEVRKAKVKEVCDKYDEIWVFEPNKNESRVLKTLGISINNDEQQELETGAYDQ